MNKDLKTTTQDIIADFMHVETEVNNLPQLSPVEKVQFDHDIAISHLYYSSKIEGSNLDQNRLDQAIHA